VTADELRPLLDAFENRLREYGAPVVEALRPGAPPERVRAKLEAEGLGAHDDLVTWWGWHDGAVRHDVDPDYEGPGIFFRPETTLVGPWHAISIADALRIRRWYRDQGLMETWVPVAQFEGQPVLCAETATPAGDPPLHIVDEGVLPGAPPQFASLADFVRTVLRLFDDGLIVPHPEQARVPWFDAAVLDGDLRRLCVW
jgi:hypothetical protein